MRFVQLKYIGHYLGEERPKPITQFKNKKKNNKEKKNQTAQAHKSHGRTEKKRGILIRKS